MCLWYLSDKLPVCDYNSNANAHSLRHFIEYRHYLIFSISHGQLRQNGFFQKLFILKAAKFSFSPRPCLTWYLWPATTKWVISCIKQFPSTGPERWLWSILCHQKFHISNLNNSLNFRTRRTTLIINIKRKVRTYTY